MGDTTVQTVRVLSVAQAVDEGSQLTHVVHFSSHHHLFMDDVGLRQVCSLLQETITNELMGACFPTEALNSRIVKKKATTGICTHNNVTALTFEGGYKMEESIITY